jgi:hypothetical protein
MPVREFDCLRFGTAMEKPAWYAGKTLLSNPPAYGDFPNLVKSGVASTSPKNRLTSVRRHA